MATAAAAAAAATVMVVAVAVEVRTHWCAGRCRDLGEGVNTPSRTSVL